MHLILGEARRNSGEAEPLYAGKFPNRQTPSRHFEHQLRLVTFVFVCLFPFEIHIQGVLK
jgi:hypothetical protein